MSELTYGIFDTREPEKVAEFWGQVIGEACELTWQYQCPECEACFEMHYDAADTEVSCEHCPWKGKAGK